MPIGCLQEGGPSSQEADQHVQVHSPRKQVPLFFEPKCDRPYMAAAGMMDEDAWMAVSFHPRLHQ
eukprot:11178116-Lingulodinium_polyedra.AAC.1